MSDPQAIDETSKSNAKDLQTQKPTIKPIKLVAVHLGAGNKTRNDMASMKFAKTICEEVMYQSTNGEPKLVSQGGSNEQVNNKKWKQTLSSNKNHRKKNKDYALVEGKDISMSAESAVVQLILRMEDNHNLNCGYGSNLNMMGHVECDASLMCDKTQMWTGVGAVPGCMNPILLAKHLYDIRSVPRPLGLIQPNLLVGSGAKQWMREHCPELNITDSKLVSSKAFSTYQKLKSRYDATLRSNKFNNEQHKHQHQSQLNEDHLVQDNDEVGLDTVGAIAVDCDNNFASAISSGGLLLKFKGRLGQAAVPGAGCWSEDSVAVTTTGVGEYLTLSMFAKKFYDKMSTLRLLFDLGHVDKNQTGDLSNLISRAIEECFEDLMQSKALDHVALEERLAGMLSVTTLNSKNSPNRVDENDLYLSFAHNTKSMCVGYMTRNDVVGHSFLSTSQTSSSSQPFDHHTANESTLPSKAADQTLTSNIPASVVRTIKFSLG